MFWKKDILIEPYGLRNGLRLKKDGYTFFGGEKRLNFKNMFENKKKRILNDFILNYEIDDPIIENLFFIQFDKSK